jgi:predicted secreted Zn-dependent protease
VNDAGISKLTWYKSSFSSGNGQCTTCARRPSGGMAVKDSKHPDGPALLFTASQWQAFIHEVKHHDPE